MGLIDYLIVTYLATAFEVGSYVNKNEVKCMAQNLWFESRGEDIVGHIKVAQTVYNRMTEKDHFLVPNVKSACSVIWKPGAFEWTEDEVPNSVNLNSLEKIELYKELIYVSVRALSGDYIGSINGSTHYYNAAKVTPCWKDSFDDFLVHGNHTWAYNSNGKTPCWDAKRIAMNDTGTD